MKKFLLLPCSLLSLGLLIAPAATFTPGNVVVLKCAGVASGGNAGSLVEYTSSGTVAQTITLASSGSPAIVFGSTVSLPHDISLSGDGAMVVIPGYLYITNVSVEGTTSASDNRVIATVKWDGTVSYPIVNSALFSGQSPRGATSDGFGNFWATFTTGMRYVTPSAPTVSTTVLGTGSRACGIYNGQLYGTIAAGVSSVSPNMPAGAGSYVGYITTATSGDGFAIPVGPTLNSKAYVANYNDVNGLYAFNWNGSGWDAPYAIKFTVSGNAEHIAVDYSGANPVIYFTTTSGANNGFFKYVDTGSAGTFTPTTLATATGGAIFRGVAMAPTQPSLPNFTVQPTGVTNNYGSTVSFGPVDATGANPNAWSWLKGNVPVANGPTGTGATVSGATTTTLTISGIASGDAGTYYAVASNNGGSTTSTPAILGLAGSSITTQLKSITNAAGTTATFTVVSGGPPPLTYAWMFGNTPLSDGPSPSGSGATISGSATNTLTITGVQDADSGQYTVTVSDSTPADSSSTATLTVVDPPQIDTEPGNQNKVQGSTANFTVTASGGALFYSWLKGTTALTNGPTGNSSTNSGATSAHLAIANVQAADAGSFTVIVTNVAGAVTSTPVATLTVGVLPIVGALSDSTVVVGSNASFNAAVTGGTAPFTYTWRHNGTVMNSDNFHIFGAETDSLSIVGVDVPDRRQYSLSVSNAYGGVTVSASLYVIIDTNKPNDVPNLIIYDPFDYPTGPNPAVSFYSWENVISVYNRITGAPAFWVNTGGGLFAGVGALDENNVYGNPDGSGSSLCRNAGGLPVGTAGGRFPYPGLDCSTRQFWFFSSSTCNNHLHFGGVTNGSAYFSFLFWGDQGGVSGPNNGTYDVPAGFTSGNSDGGGNNANTFAFALGTKADDSPGENNPGNVDGPGGWRFGVFKGGGISLSSSSVNGQWSSLHCWRGHPYLIVGCYKINSGTNLVGGSITNDDVVSLWVEPPISSFGADENHLPAPDAGGMLTNWNANAAITEFAIRATLNTSPFSKRIQDLRIGKTWASVTHPHHPTVNIVEDPSSVTLSWPANDTWARDAQGDKYGYQLQSSTDLINWIQYSGTSYVPAGENFTVTVDKSAPAVQFFRLVYPTRSGAYWQY